MNSHSNARTTPQIRREIQMSASKMTLDEAARHFNVSRSTIQKWRKRDAIEDRSHRPHRPKTALSSILRS